MRIKNKSELFNLIRPKLIVMFKSESESVESLCEELDMTIGAFRKIYISPHSSEEISDKNKMLLIDSLYSAEPENILDSIIGIVKFIEYN